MQAGQVHRLPKTERRLCLGCEGALSPLAALPHILVRSGWQQNQKQLVGRGAVGASLEGKDNLLNVSGRGGEGTGPLDGTKSCK